MKKMNHWYIQIGADMNQEELTQVKQDIEKLVTDVKKLVSSNGECKTEDGKVIGKCECHPQGRPVFWLGLFAVIGGIIGAMMYRKNHS
jgi:ElaB/YqjD/DUF883 family membrane-anchored ribosome-binding protein